MVLHGRQTLYPNSKCNIPHRQEEWIITRLFGSSLASGSIETQNSPKSNLMMGDPLENSRVSFQKQNHEGVVGTQNGEYRVTMESSPKCDGARAEM
ncbi:hypothetical protein DVH24_007932 [Malus domestica]|uniref:Uncharacterized protein n=1 Tax=Malus domestica TaxID=3750 RepID=A0A498JPA9_MALDO|nr:hypothetical protein DVH24_007932 [Malus domestica]